MRITHSDLSRFTAVLALTAGLPVALAAAANTFTPTGNLNSPRVSFTMTLLNNGQVLAAGGEDNILAHASLATAETYNPATGLWSLTGNLTTARSGHTATLLANGKVLVAGGCATPSGCTALASAEIYDPATGSWTATGSMKSPRQSHQASLLADGRVLVTGGIAICNSTVCNVLSTAELYNPQTGVWTFTTSMPTGRLNHTSTTVTNGQVLITGGCAVTGGPCPNLGAMVYNPAGATWSPTGPMNVNRTEAAATLLSNGKVLVSGGLDPGSFASTAAELFDPATLTWSATGRMRTARFGHTATALATGDVLAAGGTAQTAEIYNVAMGTFTLTGDMSTSRTDHRAALLATASVLVAGGQGISSSSVLQSAELYQPGATPLVSLSTTAIDFGTQQVGTTSPASTITVTNNGTAALTVTSVSISGANAGDFQASGCVGTPVAAGGTCVVNVQFAPTFAYGRRASVDLADNAPDSPQSVGVTGTGFIDAPNNWQPAGNMGSGRMSLTLSLLNSGKVLAAGGRFDQTAALYDPSAGTWSLTAPAKAVHTAPASTMLGGATILVTGGNTAQAETFDGAVTHTWTLVSPMSVSRTGHALSPLNNGLVLAAGGCNGTPCQSAELYHPASGTWTPAAAMGTARVGLRLVRIGSGLVLTVGGGTASAEIYNPSADQWTPAADMSTPGDGHTATSIGDGKVLVTGGCSGSPCKRAEIYDALTDTWTPAASLNVPRTQHTATRLADGRVLVSGGIYFCDPEFGFCFTTPSAEIYNPQANTWTKAPHMIVPRDLHAATLLSSGEVLAAGGENDLTPFPLASAETFRVQ